MAALSGKQGEHRLGPGARNAEGALGRAEDDRGGGASTAGGENEGAAVVRYHSEREGDWRWGNCRGGGGTHGDMASGARASLEWRIGA